MARTSSSTSKSTSETRNVRANDSAAGRDRQAHDASTPPRADGVPAEGGAVDDVRTGPGTGPMADGSPAPKDA